MDDEPDVGEMVALFLETEGFSVTTVGDGASAKQALATTAFDAVFCDLRMPHTDGPALYEWVREMVPHAADRFVFVTGDTLGSHASRFLEPAGRPVVEKPFSRETIRQAIAALASSTSR